MVFDGLLSFGAAGVSSSILAPKLMQAFGISRQVAVELAEEIRTELLDCANICNQLDERIELIKTKAES